MKNPARIMIVEDERIVAFNLQQRLAHMGYEVPAVAASGQESLDLMESTQPDLVLMDIHIEGDMDGIEVAAQLQQHRSVPVIYLTAYSEDATLARARETKPYGYLIKPFSERELHATIQMALERHSVEKALSDSQDRLHHALDAASMGVVDLDDRTRLVTLSEQAGQLLGLDATKPAPLIDFLTSVEPADRALIAARLDEDTQTLRRFSQEFRLLTEGAQPRWVRLDGRRESGTGISGVVQDISERKQSEIHLHRLNEKLELLVLERTNELRESLKELEAFSYSVAHDLRSPIRAIVGFSGLLLEEQQDVLDPDALRLLGKISAAGTRMGHLIDALLSLSKLTRSVMQPVDTSVSDMAFDIVQQLMETEPGRGAQVSVAPDMRCLADPVLLRSVLDNLIRNAWKFCSHNEVTRIDIGRDSSVGDASADAPFYVHDNGCGFDMAMADHLFSPFHRLHHEEEFNGSGLGLSIVQRIVARHGGRVWARSSPGQGATFYFTIPSQGATDNPA